MSEQSIIQLTPVRDLFGSRAVDFDNHRQDSSAKALRNNRTLCRSCFNLHNVSASVMLGLRGGLWASDDSAIDSRQNEPWDVAYEFHSEFKKISAASMRDPPCRSCLVLREAIIRLRQRIVGPAEKPGMPMEVRVVFRHGTVLRISLFREKKTIVRESKATKRESGDDDLLTSLDTFGWILDTCPIHSKWDEGEWLDDLELYTLPDVPCPLPSIGTSMAAHFPAEGNRCRKGGTVRHVLPDPGSESCFEIIKQWIAKCKKEHPDCIEAESRIQRRLPTRLVDVGLVDNTKIRLVEPREDPGFYFAQETEYVALSHCWGPKWTWPIRCVKATLNEFKDNIPFDHLSNTFKDAIVITRRLGLRYIWIDSLCIVQDDSRDWEAEAAQMASIYDGAYLVIAATGSEDGRFGCLGTRNLGPEVISCQSPQGAPSEIYGRKAIDHSIFGVTDHDMVSGVLNTPPEWGWDYPLHNRAWCFQERLLATRVLQYTKSEMVFDCLTATQCECGALNDHDGDPLLFPRRTIQLGPKFIPQERMRVTERVHTNSLEVYRLQRLQPWFGVSDHNLYHQLWRQLIVQFSQKQITFASDALPAVSGLAQKWPRDITGRYLAGLWENQLLNNMRWQVPNEWELEVTETVDVDMENEDYVAPTWSWASAKRAVTWGPNRLDNLEYFVQIDYNRSRCHTSGPDEFGKVNSGYIFLTGRVTKVSFTIVGNEVIFGEKHDSPTFFWHPGRPDDIRRLRLLLGSDLVCLRFSTPTIASEASYPGRDCCLVLGTPRSRNLERQPDEVRQYPNVYERLGIMIAYPIAEWRHDEESEEISMYII